MSVCLQISSLQPDNITGVEFSVPVINNIRVIAPEVDMLAVVPPYYGDTVNMRFWKELGILIGGVAPSGATVLTHQAGWKYQYNHVAKTFKAWDNTGTLVRTITGVTSMGDMLIDFTIYRSHDFEIIKSGNFDQLKFIIPTHLEHKELPAYIQNEIAGVDNYDAFFADYDFEIQAVAGLGEPIGGYIEAGEEFVYVANGYMYELSALHYYNLVNFSKNVPSNAFYIDGYNIISAKLLPKSLKAKMLRTNLLLAFLFLTLYPDRNPIQQIGETQNVRPIYERWLLYQIMNLFRYNTKYNPDDDTPSPTGSGGEKPKGVPIFDLSPSW